MDKLPHRLRTNPPFSTLSSEADAIDELIALLRLKDQIGDSDFKTKSDLALFINDAHRMAARLRSAAKISREDMTQPRP